jgi:cellulose synthase/poly-beta-1,6-N-acetylglucosamine synthase-like glycosyltransferase
MNVVIFSLANLLVGCSFVFLLIHYAKRKLPKPKVSSAHTEGEPATIVICARNEAANLQKNLPKILSQKHVCYSVIVVNDRSTDETTQVLNGFAQAYPHLQVMDVRASEKKTDGKKLLLYKAICSSVGEKILVTDADCFPANDLWAHHMLSHLKSHKKIVLGYSPFVKEKNLLNYFVRFEATQAAWLYFSMAAKGKAYMGVGRNMAFYKTDFLQWYQSTPHFTAGGDDDLFVNAVANRTNVACCLHADSFVYTEAPKNWRDFFMQKARHVQAAYYYQAGDQIFLFFFALAQFTVLVLPVLLLLMSVVGFFSSWSAAIFFSAFLMLCWIMLQTIFSIKAYRQLQQQDLIKYIPLLQTIFVFYLTIVFLLSLCKGKKTWN